jgi:hypothetical protein
VDSAGFLPAFSEKLTANGGVTTELITPIDVRIGALMIELKRLGIAENTLVVLMADNGPMVHNGPPGMWLTPSSVAARVISSKAACAFRRWSGGPA